jgi:hypothetical protein
MKSKEHMAKTELARLIESTLKSAFRADGEVGDVEQEVDADLDSGYVTVRQAANGNLHLTVLAIGEDGEATDEVLAMAWIKTKIV